MSKLAITLDTTDKNVVCEVADMLRRLIATEQHECACSNTALGVPITHGQEIPDTVVYHTAHGGSLTLTEEESEYAMCTTDDLAPTVDAGAAFGLPPATHAGDWQQADLPAPPMPPTDTIVPFSPTDQVPYGLVTPQVALPAPPAPPVATPPVIISGVKLDKEGLPWDGRIHATTKTFRQSDGTWKLLRGIDPALVEKVKGELRVAMGQVAPVTTVVTPPTPPAPPALILVPPLPPASEKGWSDPPPGPAVIPGPPAADPYPDFVQFCTSNQQSGRLQYQQIVDTCGKYGITQLPMLNARHDLIPTIRAELESLCKPA